MNIDINKLKKLQQCAIQNFIERTSSANKATIVTRIGKLHYLHIASTMNIEETTKSLTKILEYKQELAKEILRCPNEKKIDQLANAIIYSDEMIKKILGMFAM